MIQQESRVVVADNTGAKELLSSRCAAATSDGMPVWVTRLSPR